jgi:hypothetical protein
MDYSAERRRLREKFREIEARNYSKPLDHTNAAILRAAINDLELEEIHYAQY